YDDLGTVALGGQRTGGIALEADHRAAALDEARGQVPGRTAHVEHARAVADLAERQAVAAAQPVLVHARAVWRRVLGGRPELARFHYQQGRHYEPAAR